ncbi:MAG: glycosyltransferase, partial [Phycisphaerae bacterium]|nr:glycosyltransferase [Phycisphaerae bacterium]
RGKGQVVAQMMQSVSADILITVDADDTYPAEAAKELLAPILAEQADMVVATRLQSYGDKAFRRLHVIGNRLVRGLINLIFRCKLTDIMSGYRAFTAELARNVPITAVGFEVETELTMQSLYHGFVIREVPIEYRQRPPGSTSKLRTFRDGLRVLWTIFNIARSVKPLTFFGALAALLLVLGVLASVPGIVQYLDHGEVESFPLLFVGVGLVILSFGSLGVGVLLHAMNVRLKEISLLMRKAAGPDRGDRIGESATVAVAHARVLHQGDLDEFADIGRQVGGQRDRRLLDVLHRHRQRAVADERPLTRNRLVANDSQ